MYACIAKVGKGGRCRNMVKEGLFCEFHKKHEREVAPPPDAVLLRFNINNRRTEKLLEKGVKIVTPDFYTAEIRHHNHALQHRRGPSSIRRGKVDSGVPVFGKEGARNVSLKGLLEELNPKGLRITNLHIQPRQSDSFSPMCVLVVTLSREEVFSQLYSPLFPEIEFLMNSAWEWVHVWANPPQEEEKIVHTVNCGHRMDPQAIKNLQILRYKDGLWGIEPSSP